MSAKVKMSEALFKKFVGALAKAPRYFLLSPQCRQIFALTHFNERGRPVREYTETSDGVMPGTVAHNRLQIDDGTFASAERTLRLINPIAAIGGIFEHELEQKVLSIGPRTEMELFHLVGAGFHPDNITAVDLISTSPWIDLGDMHKLPYADRSFDVVISSWVLGYSSTPQKAVDEMVRVTRSGGVIAIGCTHNPDAEAIEYKTAETKIQGARFRHVDQYRALIGDKLDWVYYQDEPRDGAHGAVIIVARIKH
ncbi:MAG: class I SAM-dependent methyltransferase [Rhodospirillaceae bacterium]|nr:class I SAM-dependent methyltransferase [Rhodospirillaceae bacterium]